MGKIMIDNINEIKHQSVLHRVNEEQISRSKREKSFKGRMENKVCKIKYRKVLHRSKEVKSKIKKSSIIKASIYITLKKSKTILS